jgi:uncharacterized membrane protein
VARTHGSVSLRARRTLAAASVVLGIITVIGVIALWPEDEVVNSSLRDVVGTAETYDADVISVVERSCAGTLPEDDLDCSRITFRLLDGPDEGDRFFVEFTGASPLASVESGSTIVVARNPNAPPQVRYSFVDIQRRSVLFILALVFAIAVVLLGRLQGVAALIGLALTFVLLLEFVLPAILSGRDPTLVAAFAASAMAYLSLYLAHGFGAMTSIALLGTLASLMLTVALGSIFVGLAKFSGLASEEAFLVSVGASNLDLSGLILAGVIIGALGAIDDVTVTQASAVAEISSAGPDTSRSKLFRGGLRIGRDHVASTVNTLFLAYVGASLPLLLLFVLTDQSPIFVANRELVATEIVRALVGSIGLVASVPLTTWLASYCYQPRSQRRTDGAEEERPANAASEDGGEGSTRNTDDLYIPESRFEAFRRRHS